jgi:hypothetical protein
MGAVMFVLFKSALTSRLLFVNPSLVRTVVDGDQMGQVKICFDDQHSVTVQGAATEVAQKLTGTSEQTAPHQGIVSPGGFDTRAGPLISPCKVSDPH